MATSSFLTGTDRSEQHLLRREETSRSRQNSDRDRGPRRPPHFSTSSAGGPSHMISQAGNVHLGVNYGTINQIAKLQRTDLLSRLNPILDASHTRNMKHSPPNSQCLPGTRRRVLRKVWAWSDSNDIETDPHILWIYGFAGCGKSAIAHEAAKILSDLGRLAACFVFFRGSGDRSTVARFANTVASQVAAAIPKTKPLIELALKRNPGLASTATTSVSEQFEHLVYRPIRTIASRTFAPFIIVLDGADECQDHNDVSTLVDNMIDFFDRHPRTPLRILITSRVEDHLHQVLHSSPQVELLNLVEMTSDADIATALTAAIQKEARGQVLSRHGPWPCHRDMQKLVKHIGGSFIFMSTIIKMLFDRNIQDGLTPMDRLPLVLSTNPSFDALYKQILMPCQHLPHFYALMTAMTLAFRPLSIAELADILDIKTYDVANILIHVNAIIQVPDDDYAPVTLWHTSLRDYLSAERRSGQLFVNPAHHRWLVHRCIQSAVTPVNGRSPSSEYSRYYAIHHLTALAETMDYNAFVYELCGVMSMLLVPAFKRNQTAFDAACRGGHWKLVSALISAGIDVNTPLPELDNDGILCALHAACEQEEVEMIYLLLEKGADPNIASHHEGHGHGTPLAFAAAKGDVKLATRLLECSADPNLQGGVWGTALRAACTQGSLGIVELLLDHGADPNMGLEKWSPLHSCAINGHQDCARALLMRKADPNPQYNGGDTPLHVACHWRYDKVVECLLEFKADASIKDNEGKTALRVAQERGQHDVVDVLRRHGIRK